MEKKTLHSALILVTGSTGYIASRLIPRLLERGYQVRCLARDPLQLRGRSWFRQVDVFQGDVTVPSTLPPALQGVHTAYYLIHNMLSGHGYTERELEGARNFAMAAGTAGIEHIIYLGGLADPEQHIAPHMRSRIETGAILRGGKTPVTEFRAGVIIGSGSISFEMIRFMTELFPIVPAPGWMMNQSQPIAIQNVTDYLLAALENPTGRGGIFEIGGPDITTYGRLMLHYAHARGLKRRMLLLPGIPLWFMAFGIGLMTPVPRPIAYALVAGLAHDSVVQHADALRVFTDIQLIGFDEATSYALKQNEPSLVERIWEDRQRNGQTLKHEGFFIEDREMTVDAPLTNAYKAITRVIRKPQWRVEVNEQDHGILIRDLNQRAGDKWIEWRLESNGDGTRLIQTAFFSPRGLPGFLHWYLLYPLHWLDLQILIRTIANQSKEH
ncbi:MAG: SDR family oxidoreductase [Chloroflexota bacterium]|nr:SDR family oxidoreductase [Chloroflexota bacterium]